MQLKTFFNEDVARLFYIYLVANIFFLLNYQGIYWDDWTLYNQDNASMMNQFRMNGGIIAGYMHSFLLSIGNGIFIYRLLVFITFFLSGVFIYKILSRYMPSSKDSAFWIVLVYLTVPLNSAKIALINAPSIFLLFIFFGAFYLLTKYLAKSKSIWLRILILSLFFISFFMGSLLVFYAIALMSLIYSIFMGYDEISNFKRKVIYTTKTFLFKYLDFLILPIVFYIFKNIYFKPSGLYAGYNQISFSVEKIINLIKTSFATSVYDPILISLQTSLSYWYVSIIVFITILLLLRNKTIGRKKYSLYIIVLILGIIFYILAVFPYAVVGKLPQLGGWESRHQILMSLGIAFMLYASIASLSGLNRKLPSLIFTILITAFVVQNTYNGTRYLQDWYYQVSMEENFKSSKIIQEHSTFIVNVQLEGSLANGRNLSFYEQNGRLKKVFGNDKRFMVRQKKDIESYKKYKNYKQYNFSSWVYQEPISIKITKNNLPDNQAFYLFKMLYYQISDPQIFRSMAKELIIIEIRENKNV